MGLDSVELIMRIEEEFSIEISDIEAGEILTVGDFYKLILKKIDRADDNQEIWEMLCNAIIEQGGVPRAKITPDARIVDDLGID